MEVCIYESMYVVRLYVCMYVRMYVRKYVCMICAEEKNMYVKTRDGSQALGKVRLWPVCRSCYLVISCCTAVRNPCGLKKPAIQYELGLPEFNHVRN